VCGALGRIIIGRQEGHPAHKITEWWGAGVVVCLEKGADNSMIYTYKLYDLHVIFYFRLSVSKSIFMFP